MAKRIPRVTDPAKPPHNAVHFDVWRLHKKEGVNPEGKRYSTWKPVRLTAGVGDDGRVSDRWLVEELSPQAITARWGSGRYRIRYLGAAYELVGSVDWELQAPADRSGGPLELDAAAAPGGASSPADRLRGLAGQLGGASIVELMLMLNDARDSAARQARDDADRAAAKDRQFFDKLFQMQQQHAPAAAAAAAPAVDMTRELALMRREMALTIREETQRIRADILNELPDDPDGPEDVSAALNAAGVATVEGIGEQMPEVIGGLLNKLKAWLQLNGQPATPADMAKLIEAAQAAVAAQAAAEANGVGN